MFELFRAGGWIMLPLLACSIAMVAICLERFMVLNPRRIMPPGLLESVWDALNRGELDANRIRRLREGSPMGAVLAAGLNNARQGRLVMRESIEQAAGHVVHELEKHLSLLGTIAAVTPLLGLLGTVMGMIRVFSEIMLHGTGNASVLAGGISEALITTATGLAVAIPALALHRYYLRRIDDIVIDMEHEASQLLNALYNESADNKSGLAG